MDTASFVKLEIIHFLMTLLLESACGLEKYTGKVLLVGYDGFRWDYMNLTDTPNLDKFKAEGSSAPYINNVFTSITFPSMYSIVTGRYYVLVADLNHPGLTIDVMSFSGYQL